MTDGIFIDTAHVQYGDLRGSVAVDYADFKHLSHELGAQSGKWFIVAVRLTGGGRYWHLVIYLAPSGSVDGAVSLARDGVLDVTKVSLPMSTVPADVLENENTPWGLLRRTTKRFDLVLVHRAVNAAGVRLQEIDERDWDDVRPEGVSG